VRDGQDYVAVVVQACQARLVVVLLWRTMMGEVVAVVLEGMNFDGDVYYSQSKGLNSYNSQV